MTTPSDLEPTAPTEEVFVGPASGPAGTGTVTRRRTRGSTPRGVQSVRPAPPPGPVPRPRRLPTPIRPSDFGPQDVVVLLAAALASLCLVWVVFYQLTLLSGIFGFLVCWYLTFLALVYVATYQLVERQAAADRVAAVLMVTGALIIMSLVVFIVLWVFAKALPSVHWGSLFTKDQKNFQPAAPNALSTVGVLHAVIGSLEQVALAALIGVPLAVLTAIFLNEVRGFGVRTIRTVVTAMSGTPSVVAGIFIYSTLVLTHVLPYSGFAAALALIVILLPSVTRVVEEVLRIVPGGLREASLALGAPQWRTVWSVVLPTARSGVITAILLGVARIVGETAPLLFTAFGSQVLNANPFNHDQGALPLVIWSNVRTAQPVLIDLAFQAAAVLITIVLILFVTARILGRTKGKRRKGSESEDDVLARMFVPVPMEGDPNP